jgi:hypothetical protein
MACCAPRCRKLHRAHLPPRAHPHAAQAQRPQGQRPVHARDLGRSAGDIAQRLQAIAARDPRPSCPTATPAPWAWCRARAWTGASSTAWAPRCWTAPSARHAGGEALVHTLGGKVGMKVEFFAESKLILIWGSNSIGSNLHFWRYAQQAKRNGAKLVCIDPRKSETADKCHEHIALLPRHRRRAGAGADARADRPRLAGPRLHRPPHLGWEQLRERALQWPPERAAEVCGMPVEQIRQLARDYGTTQARRHPPELRHAARARRRQRRARRGLPARAHRRLAAPRGRRAAVQLGQFPVERAALQRPTCWPARTPRTINMVTIGDDLLREASPAFGPRSRPWWSTTATPWPWRPIRARWCRALRARTCSPWCWSTFRPTRPTTPTTSCPPPRSWSTGTCTWPTATPTCCSTARPSRPWARRAATRRSSATWPRAWALPSPALPTATKRCAARPLANAVDFALLETPGLCHAGGPDAPFAEGGFPTPSGRCEFFSARLAAQGMDGLPDHVPNHELQGTDARYPLAMISPPARNFLNSTFVNVQSLRTSKAARCWRSTPTTPPRAALPTAAPVRVFNDRGSYRMPRRSVHPRPPRRGQRPGHLVAQAGAERHQRERAHQPGLG